VALKICDSPQTPQVVAASPPFRRRALVQKRPLAGIFTDFPSSVFVRRAHGPSSCKDSHSPGQLARFFSPGSLRRLFETVRLHFHSLTPSTALSCYYLRDCNPRISLDPIKVLPPSSRPATGGQRCTWSDSVPLFGGDFPNDAYGS